MIRNRVYFSSLILLLVVLLASCGKDKGNNLVSDKIAELKEQYAPDSRTARFEIEPIKKGEELVLKGHTTSLVAWDELKTFLDSNQVVYIDSVVTYPDNNIGNAAWGVVSVSVSNIRSKPKHSAELVTQELMGSSLKLLSKENNWYLVQTPNKYIGWLDDEAIVTKTKTEKNAYDNGSLATYHQSIGWVYQKPNKNAQTISDIVAGCRLTKQDGFDKGFQKVSLPDGRLGFVPASALLPLKENISFVKTAKRFLGVPYLWGGTSSKGFDCSGFTKTVYDLNGYLLPRDASQQVHVGKEIKTNKSWKNLLPGDLLFFGSTRDDGSQKVTHVALYMGNGKIIHSSGRVKIESLNPDDDDFAKNRYDTFLKAKRIVE